MSSLFSKLCPFLRPEVMYGDTPLDISCFTTFISVQQYLTLCPPSHWIDRFMLISPLLAPAHSLINPPERNPGHDSQNDQASWIIIHIYFLWNPSRSFMTLFMSGQSSFSEDERKVCFAVLVSPSAIVLRCYKSPCRAHLWPTTNQNSSSLWVQFFFFGMCYQFDFVKARLER